MAERLEESLVILAMNSEEIAKSLETIARFLETIASSYEPMDGEVLEATVFPFPVNED